jgi:hypothetical protein
MRILRLQIRGAVRILSNNCERLDVHFPAVAVGKHHRPDVGGGLSVKWSGNSVPCGIEGRDTRHAGFLPPSQVECCRSYLTLRHEAVQPLDRSAQIGDSFP